MPIKHPFQSIITNKEGDLLFTATKNELQVFELKTGERVGHWVDVFDSTELLREKITKEQQRQLKANEEKAAAEAKAKAALLTEEEATATPEPTTTTTTEEPTKKKRKSNNSEPKVPTPGSGAPTIYNYIRQIKLSNDETKLVVITDSDKAAVVFQLNYDNNDNNVLELLKRQPFPKRPNAITTSNDDTEIIMGDKFGDVYKFAIADPEIKTFVGETDPLLGHVSMLTGVALAKNQLNQDVIITTDRDEHIRISQYPQASIIDKFLFGHESFISSVLIPNFDKSLLISGGGDEFICLWNWYEGKELDRFQLGEMIQPYLSDLHLAPSKFQNESGDLKEYCVAKIVELTQINSVAVLIESTNVVLVLKITDSYKLELDQVIQFDSPVTDICASNFKLIVSLESQENLIQIVDIENKSIDQEQESKDAVAKITADSLVEVESKEQFYPLYTIYQLKKRSEFS
ncbi:hypothetical protein WICPIJ_007445 [Wickerhamomyces pijperi]|uniref:Transfer RNA methyltransferase 82 n=1 Tax=Wickerhamomyces pijperi TaxID=599730 RepID=A0A9P8TJW2_WICPI|nr:hypothetical protein WICPIJ_007445 [Wickerhamomyces pijperi]